MVTLPIRITDTAACPQFDYVARVGREHWGPIAPCPVEAFVRHRSILDPYIVSIIFLFIA